MYTDLRRKRERQRRLLAFGLVGLLLVLIAAASALTGLQEASTTEQTAAVTRAMRPETGQPETLSAWGGKPGSVRGIYLTAANASDDNIDTYLNLLDRTELNAAVVDVKDVTGEVTYPSDVPLAQEIGATRDTLNLKPLVEKLKEHDVYTIARVATFEDDILPRERPELAVKNSSTGGPWLNYAGGAWADPYDRGVWEYNVAIAKEAAKAGFDEIQFDYVRFPSDGPMAELDYEKETFPSRADAIATFLEYAHDELEPLGVYVAADVFGLAATLDAGVGQDVTKIAPHLDVICPMVYPSHFPSGSYGLPEPNAEPYATIENALADFDEKAGAANPRLEIRPWLQDFDYGPPPYGPEEVQTQIEATYDSGETSWLLWNPSNDYTEEALAPEGSGGST